MNSPNRFQRLSTGIALAVLAFGFVCLGVVSLVVNHREGAETRTFSETTYSILGSTTSVLLGATFFVAMILFSRIRLASK
jgi:branched-subunit amino acid permease